MTRMKWPNRGGGIDGIGRSALLGFQRVWSGVRLDAEPPLSARKLMVT